MPSASVMMMASDRNGRAITCRQACLESWLRRFIGYFETASNQPGMQDTSRIRAGSVTQRDGSPSQWRLAWILRSLLQDQETCESVNRRWLISESESSLEFRARLRKSAEATWRSHGYGERAFSGSDPLDGRGSPGRGKAALTFSRSAICAMAAAISGIAALMRAPYWESGIVAYAFRA